MTQIPQQSGRNEPATQPGSSVDSTNLKLPKIEIRLPASRACLLHAGFDQIAEAPSACHLSWCIDREFLARRKNLKYDAELMEKTLRLRKKVIAIEEAGGRHRMVLDFIDLSICLIAARELTRLVKHGHVIPSRPDYACATRKLVEQLEAYRKRAVRACEKESSRERYRQIQARWTRFVNWLGVYGTFCGCRKRRGKSRNHYGRKVIDRCVDEAKDYLRWLEIELPEEKTLRKYVLAALRNNTAYRRSISIPALRQDPHLAWGYLGTYCARRIEKSKLQREEQAERTNNRQSGVSANDPPLFDAEAAMKAMFGE